MLMAALVVSTPSRPAARWRADGSDDAFLIGDEDAVENGCADNVSKAVSGMHAPLPAAAQAAVRTSHELEA